MAAIRTEAQLPQALSMSSKYNHQHKGVNCSIVLLCCMVAATPQSMMNAKLSLHGFRHCYENGLIKTIKTTPHNLYVSFKYLLWIKAYPGLS